MTNKIFTKLFLFCILIQSVFSSTLSDTDRMAQVMKGLNTYTPGKSIILDSTIPTAIDHIAKHIIERHFGINKNWYLYIDNSGKKNEKIFVRSAFIFSDDTLSRFPKIAIASASSAAYATCRFEEEAMIKLLPQKKGEKIELQKIQEKIAGINEESFIDNTKCLLTLKGIVDTILSYNIAITSINKALDIVTQVSSLPGTEPYNRLRLYESILTELKDLHDAQLSIIDILNFRIKTEETGTINKIKTDGLAQASIILQKIIKINSNLEQISQSFANQETESTAAIIDEESVEYTFLMDIARKIVNLVMKNANIPIHTSVSRGIFFKIPDNNYISSVISELKGALATADIPIGKKETRVDASHLFLALDISQGISFDTCYPISLTRFKQMISEK